MTPNVVQKFDEINSQDGNITRRTKGKSPFSIDSQNKIEEKQSIKVIVRIRPI